MKSLRQKACWKCDMKKFIKDIQDDEKRLRYQVTESCINKSKNGDVLKFFQQYL